MVEKRVEEIEKQLELLSEVLEKMDERLCNINEILKKTVGIQSASSRTVTKDVVQLDD